MRATYRSHGGSRQYWDQRWTNASVDVGSLNLNKYPGKYAQEMVDRTDGPLLEAGCGLGRNVIYFHNLGREITGIDFIETAIDKIKDRYPDLDVQQADILDLPFSDHAFAGVMAFGLYHSLENGVDKALSETHRVLRPGGVLVTSARLDNIQNRFNDWIEEKKSPPGGEPSFHKANYTVTEFRNLLTAAGFVTDNVEYVENMPLFYKFRVFRSAAHKAFDESLGRSEGYQLNWVGNTMQKTLVALFPRWFSNIVVVSARRPLESE